MRGEKLVAAFVSIIFPILTLFCSGQAQQAGPKPDEGKITGVRFVAFPPSEPDGSVKFQLAIEGENLPAAASCATVLFETKDPAHPVNCAGIVSSEAKEILVEATAKAKTEVTRIRLVKDDRPVADSKAFAITITENSPKPKIDKFDVKLEHEKNKQFPNLHSLVFTKESGDGGFADNPHRMTVDLMPSGASDVNIVESSPEQLDVHFVAAADYEPTSAVITVYDSSDLDCRKAVAVAASKKTPEDPNEPKVTGTEIVFINRSHGVGRFRILGKNFGDYEAPPYPVDDYLWNCLEEFHIRGTDPVRARDLELKDLEQRLEACRQTLNGQFDNKPEPKDLKARLDYTKTNLASFIKTPKKHPEEWAREIRDKVTVSVNSRDPDIQVEKVEILDINDEMIDVYFEFTRYRGYAWPFRLGEGTVIVKKKVQKTTQTVKNDKVTGTVSSEQKPEQKPYSVPYQTGPKRDANLAYRYTVLDHKSANTLLGRGIADNFYVLQLSVVNNGDKKVAIPLSAIQAEVEWIRGEDEKKKKTTEDEKKETGDEKKKPKHISYMVGPPTESPMPLAAVSAYFDAYQKSQGRRAILFNALDATTTILTALVPFTGHSLKDAEVFFSGGFVPGLHKALGDLSSQQLQNLTSLSWESSETLAAKGGSMEKLIYIQKFDQFKSTSVEMDGISRETRQQIASIMGLEVTGYEVVESDGKTGTPAPDKSQGSGKTPTAGQSEQKPAAPAAAEKTPTEGGTPPKK